MSHNTVLIFRHFIFENITDGMQDVRSVSVLMILYISADKACFISSLNTTIVTSFSWVFTVNIDHIVTEIYNL